MQLSNTSKFVQHFGGVSIEPGRAGSIDDEWARHPVVEKLAEQGVVMVARGYTPPKAPAEPAPAQFDDGPKVVPTVEEKEGQDPTPLEALAGADVPEGWDGLHTNKCKAWIRRCDDRDALLALLETEERAKVASALRDRVEALEARP